MCVTFAIPVVRKSDATFCCSEAREATSAAEEPVPRGLVEAGFGEQAGQAAATARGDQAEPRLLQERQNVVESHLEADRRDDLGLDLRESG